MDEASLVKLRYTNRSLADIDHILTYLTETAPHAKARVQLRFEKMLTMLLAFPHSGNRTRKDSIYRLATSPYPYLIFYEPTQDEIIVHAVRHDARSPQSMPAQ